ncbi:hypothetical protein Tco_1286565 [Tanacetum coccineum]
MVVAMKVAGGGGGSKGVDDDDDDMMMMMALLVMRVELGWIGARSAGGDDVWRWLSSASDRNLWPEKRRHQKRGGREIWD